MNEVIICFVVLMVCIMVLFGFFCLFFEEGINQYIRACAEAKRSKEKRLGVLSELLTELLTRKLAEVDNDTD